MSGSMSGPGHPTIRGQQRSPLTWWPLPVVNTLLSVGEREQLTQAWLWTAISSSVVDYNIFRYHIEFKYCEDTRPQNQQHDEKEQNREF
jgi:hypothetical protein